MTQQTKKETINTLIKRLTPTHPLKISYKNLEIFGFDILDKDKNRLNFSKSKFYPGSQFYIVLYGKRKTVYEETPEENKLDRCNAALERKKGGYFWSTKTSYLYGGLESKSESEEWQIGGIYRVLFEFKAPEFALPGKYKLVINKEKSNHPNREKMIELEKIKINIERLESSKGKQIGDYNLSLEGCLLNPAVQMNKYIALLWTGNIEFYTTRDLRNFNKIIIIAKGTPALGVYPLLKVYVEDREIGNVYVNKEWYQYEFDLRLYKEAHILKIRFDNDEGGPGEDRNMYVKMITLLK